MAKYDSEDFNLNLDDPEKSDMACDVLRVLRYVTTRVKLESRKNWKTDDLIKLFETMLEEIFEGVTEDDKMRQLYAAQGKKAFMAGVPRARNPHPENSDYRTWWDTGWRDGEREQAASDGTSMEIQQGRSLDSHKKKKGMRYYKIQLVKDSMIYEWNEVFHQYSPEGSGTRFTDYDEARVIADQLKRAEEGIVSLLEAKDE